MADRIQWAALVILALAFVTVLALPARPPWWRPRYVVCREVWRGPYPRRRAHQLAENWESSEYNDCGPHRVIGRVRYRLHRWMWGRGLNRGERDYPWPDLTEPRMRRDLGR